MYVYTIIKSPNEHQLSVIRNPNLVITVSVDGLAPKGARPAADTVVTTMLDMMFTKLTINAFDKSFIDHTPF